MKKCSLRYLINVSVTFLVLAPAGAGMHFSDNASLHDNEIPAMINRQNDGPYIFYLPNGLLQAFYIQDNQADYFSVDMHSIPADSADWLRTGFNLEITNYYFPLPAR